MLGSVRHLPSEPGRAIDRPSSGLPLLLALSSARHRELQKYGFLVVLCSDTGGRWNWEAQENSRT